MVFLIVSGGKKWSLHYHHTDNRGKKWGNVYSIRVRNMGRGDYPLFNESPDKMTNPNFYP